MAVSILVDEHSELEGDWTLRKSCRKQFKSQLLLNTIAIIPFKDMLKGKLTERQSSLLYLLKIVRIFYGLKLLDY